MLAPFLALQRRLQLEAARDGFSFAICLTVAASSSALNDGYEQIRLLQANAAGSPRSGYSTSGLGNLPSPQAQPFEPLVARGERPRRRMQGLGTGIVLVPDDGHVGRLDREFFI